jgi:hypothetical protein
MIDIFVVIKDGTYQYCLLKVQRRGFDVYCFPPHLGLHHSRHSSGESHFQFEVKSGETGKKPPVVLVEGEAGTPIGNGIMATSLANLGCASGICTAICPIDSLDQDFEEFNRSPQECFVIDRRLLSEDTRSVEIGIWAVPARNTISFEFNNRDIPAGLLYKVASCEPQIWIYASPV